MGDVDVQMLVKLVQQVQAGLETLRAETQAGFAALHAEQARTNQKLDAQYKPLK